MNSYVAMLRGVNVGGSRKVPMQDLRDLFTSLGFGSVESYVQSGNLAFKTPKSDPGRLRKSIEEKLRADLGLDVPVLIRSSVQLREILQANPFIDRTDNPAILHVTFLASPPTGSALAGLSDRVVGTDEFAVAGTEVYLFCPGGYGVTKLNNSFFEKRLGVPATTRNWKTVTKLAEMTA
jgi:uncharacterized protein (DUF1697 family)